VNESHLEQTAQSTDQQRRIWAKGLFVLSGLALMVALLISAGAMLYGSETIIPGVRVMGVDVGGMRTQEAAFALQGKWQGRQIAIVAGELERVVSVEEAGFRLAPLATARLAHEQGRSWESLRAWAEARGDVAVDPIWSFDIATAEALLHSLVWQTDIGARNAGIQIVEGKVQTTEAVIGQALDVAGALAWLEAHPAEVLGSGRLSISLTPVTPAITDVTSLADQVAQWLQDDVAIDLYDPILDEQLEWIITPATIGEWVRIDLDSQNAARHAVTLDMSLLDEYLAVQSSRLGDGRYVEIEEAAPRVADAIQPPRRYVSLRVYHSQKQHIVQAGETLSSIAFDYGIPYPWIQAENPGMVDSLSPDQVVRIPSPDVMLPLPVVEGKRIIVSLAEQTVRVYEAGQLKWDWPASTGMSSSPTSPGIFQIQSHEEEAYAASWNLWMPYFMGIYRPVPASDFMNGFHGYTSRDGQPLLWMRNLGTPVTYGCILLSTENAALLYDWAEDGVVVEIQRQAGGFGQE